MTSCAPEVKIQNTPSIIPCIMCFSGCIPWPCFDLLGMEDPEICQHYVQAPDDVKVEFVDEPNPKSDTVIVSWKPSYYGMFIWF